MNEPDNLSIAKQYLRAVERGAVGAELKEFFTSDMSQEEYPNSIVPNGMRRDLAGILAAADRGQSVMASQTFELNNAIAQDDQVLLEILWTGTLGVPYGTLPIGGQMKARVATVLEFRGGRIASQRNYDCYYPWSTDIVMPK
jgi:ketosteroid isomerase-like protein